MTVTTHDDRDHMAFDRNISTMFYIWKYMVFSSLFHCREIKHFSFLE